MRRRIYMHFGGRYDMFFLPPLQQIILSGSGILKAQHGQASVYDSWFTFQMALKKIGKAIGKLKLEGRSNRMEELTDAEAAEQALNDAEILALALKLHRAWVASFPHPDPRWPPTSGATAMYLMESLEPEFVEYLRGQLLSLEEWVDQAAAVSGGRVEIHYIGVPKVRRLYAYDINSSYPRSWMEAPLPVGPWLPVDREVPHLPGVYECEVRQSREHFPVVAPEFMWKYDGRCWLTSEELAAVRESGGAARVARGWVSTTEGPLGQRFIQTMYERKLAGDPWAKLTINCPHGKFDQGIFQQAYYRLRDGTYAVDRELGFLSWFQRPLIGAFILARARIRLWRTMEALRAAGWQVFYLDTDCIHTDCPPESFPGALGPELGAYKLEVEASMAVYVAPKVYGLEKSEEWWAKEKAKDPEAQRCKVVCKGFPAKMVSMDTLLRAARGERVSVKERAGLTAFRSQLLERNEEGEPLGWGPRVATLERTLCIQKGGKKYERRGTGSLIYPDSIYSGP